MVPTSRLELLRRFRPPAPQAGVSTNFTTWARCDRIIAQKSLRYVFCLRTFGRRRGRLLGCLAGCFRRRFFACRRSRRGDLLFRRIEHAAARGLGLVGREVGESEAGEEENRRQHRGGAREEIRRSGGAEKTPGGAAAEARAHVRALAVL